MNDSTLPTKSIDLRYGAAALVLSVNDNSLVIDTVYNIANGDEQNATAGIAAMGLQIILRDRLDEVLDLGLIAMEKYATVNK